MASPACMTTGRQGALSSPTFSHSGGRKGSTLNIQRSNPIAFALPLCLVAAYMVVRSLKYALNLLLVRHVLFLIQLFI